MKQRVNIQYSIEVEELPQEISRMLQKGVATFEKLGEEDIKGLSETRETDFFSLQTLDTIETARSKLAAIDCMLNDAAKIINGFMQIKVRTSDQSAETEAPAPPEEEHEPPSTAPMFPPKWDELTQQLENFKNKTAPEITE